MPTTATTPEAYIQQIEDTATRAAVERLHLIITEALATDFEAIIQYGMIGYSVPHSVYPSGYHCDPKQPLPFVSLAVNKGGISLYHMGIYADKELLEWFTNEYPKHSKTKLDMGKSCIKFKKPDHIPFELIYELIQRMGIRQWIGVYEVTYKKQ
jgi:hypothetical protein